LRDRAGGSAPCRAGSAGTALDPRRDVIRTRNRLFGLVRPRRRHRELAVVEHAPDGGRIALVRIDAGREATVLAVDDVTDQLADDPGGLLARIGLRGRRPVVVATSGATLRVEPELDGCRLTAALDSDPRCAWSDAAQRAGVLLSGVYPLLGCALAGVRVDDSKRPGLLLQVERSGTAIVEHAGPHCRGVEQVRHDAPSVRACLELLGEGCPTALLCGGGADLSELGYQLVGAGSTWIRLAPLLARVECAAEPATLAAVVGAARHAAGLAPPDSTARATAA